MTLTLSIPKEPRVSKIDGATALQFFVGIEKAMDEAGGEMNELPAVFYTYALFRDDGRIFYIGKGKGNRWEQHEKPSVLRRPRCYKSAIIRGMQARGTAVIKIKIHEGLTESIAHEYEIALIKAIGRAPGGPLVNLTTGGEGAAGLKLSLETRAKIGASGRGRKVSATTREKNGTARRGKRHSPESRAKVAAARFGTKASPETRAKLSAMRLGIKRLPETIEKTAAAHRGRKRSPETRAKISAAKRRSDLKRIGLGIVAIDAPAVPAEPADQGGE